MPRKGNDPASAPASRNSSKRPAAEPLDTRPKRPRGITRQSYIEPDTDTDDADNNNEGKVLSDHDDDEATASEYGEHGDQNPSSESEPDEPASEDDTEPDKATPRGRPAKSRSLPIHKARVNEKDLWKPGAKLLPGTQLIIKKPKARDAGDTPYIDATIHPNTM